MEIGVEVKVLLDELLHKDEVEWSAVEGARVV